MKERAGGFAVLSAAEKEVGVVYPGSMTLAEFFDRRHEGRLLSGAIELGGVCGEDLLMEVRTDRVHGCVVG